MNDRYTKLAARFYDLGERKDDIPFILKYAKKVDGEILELGCGTGRVTIPLLRRGYKVTAVDSSRNMIQRINQKTHSLPVRERLQIMHGDITNINLKKRYKLILMPYRVFQCFLTVVEQKKALLNVRRHLSANGLFIFDQYFPNLSILSQIPSAEMVDARYKIGKTTVIKTHQAIKHDELNQVVTTRLRYYLSDKNRKHLITQNTFPMRYSFKAETEHLLQICGFNVKNVYSDFRSTKFTANKEMIFVCGLGSK